MSLFAPGFAITRTASKGQTDVPRLPVLGRRHNGRMRLPILFPFAENPPTRFRQMTGHRDGGLAVALFRFHPVIERQSVMAAEAMPVHQDAIRRFHKRPPQIVVGLLRRRPACDLPPLACTVGTSPA